MHSSFLHKDQRKLTELSEGYRAFSSKVSPASAAIWIEEDKKETLKNILFSTIILQDFNKAQYSCLFLY